MSQELKLKRQHATRTKKELSQSLSVPSLSLPDSSTIRQQQSRPASSNRNTSRILTQRLGAINEQLSSTKTGTGKDTEKNSDSFKAWQAKRIGKHGASGVASAAGSVVGMSTCRQLDSGKSSNRYVKMPRPFWCIAFVMNIKHGSLKMILLLLLRPKTKTSNYELLPKYFLDYIYILYLYLRIWSCSCRM